MQKPILESKALINFG